MRSVLHATWGRSTLGVLGVAALTAGAALALAPVASSATAVTLYVDKAGTSTSCASPGVGACPTIQQAVDAGETRAASDVTVSIAAGTYAENVNVFTVPAGDTLTLAGSGQASTVIDGTGGGEVVEQTAGVLSLAGLTLTGGVHGVGVGGSPAGTTSLALSQVTVRGSSNVGVTVSNAYRGAVTVDRSTLSGNGLGGLVVIANDPQDTSPVTITRSTITGNGSDGVFVRAIAQLDVRSSTFDSNAGAGLNVTTGKATVGNSTFVRNGTNLNVGNSAGLVNNYPADATVSASTFSQPTADAVDVFDQYYNGLASVTLGSSVFSGGKCTLSTSTDAGYSVESGHSCTKATTSVRDSATIGLSSVLQANGSSGPQTLAIASTSSARDLVPAAACPVADERGVSRSGTTCDAGAYEYGGSVATPPDAKDTAVTSVDGAAVRVDLAKLTDAHGLTATYAITAAPSHGTTTLAGSVVTYKPTSGYRGSDSFTYTITTAGGTASGIVTIDDQLAPVANADKAATYGSPTGPGTTIAIEVLGNDVARTGTLSVASVSSPAHGTASTDGTVARYTPAKGFFGTDTFTYTAGNGSGTAKGQVTVVVQK